MANLWTSMLTALLRRRGPDLAWITGNLYRALALPPQAKDGGADWVPDTHYLDLDPAAAAGDGSIGAPWNWTQFKAQIAAPNTVLYNAWLASSAGVAVRIVRGGIVRDALMPGFDGSEGKLVWLQCPPGTHAEWCGLNAVPWVSISVHGTNAGGKKVYKFTVATQTIRADNPPGGSGAMYSARFMYQCWSEGWELRPVYTSSNFAANLAALMASTKSGEFAFDPSTKTYYATPWQGDYFFRDPDDAEKDIYLDHGAAWQAGTALVEVAERDHVLQNVDSDGSTNRVKFWGWRGLKFRGGVPIDQRGIANFGDHNQVLYCEAWGSRAYGIRLGATQTGTRSARGSTTLCNGGDAVGIVFRGNYAHDNGQGGVSASAVIEYLEEFNVYRRNGNRGFDSNFDGGGRKFATCRGISRYNIAGDNRGYGLWDDVRCQGTVFESNRVHTNTNTGLSAEWGERAIVRSNVGYHNGHGRTEANNGADFLFCDAGVTFERNVSVRGRLCALLRDDSRANADQHPELTARGSHRWFNKLVAFDPGGTTTYPGSDHRLWGLVADGNDGDRFNATSDPFATSGGNETWAVPGVKNYFKKGLVNGVATWAFSTLASWKAAQDNRVFEVDSVEYDARTESVKLSALLAEHAIPTYQPSGPVKLLCDL